MYFDLISYCPDTAALAAELSEKLPAYLTLDEATGQPVFLVDKTPTVRNGAETLALLRLSQEEVERLEAAQLSTLTVLGTYEDVFADPAKRAVYDRVYDQRPVTVVDENGVETLVSPPERFGVFAG
jgi:hypothetical protein